MRSGHIGAPCESRYGREEGSWGAQSEIPLRVVSR
jgi:hypothetical protein